MVHRLGDHITFETYDSQAIPLEAGSTYNYISRWSPDQLKLAQDQSRTWVLKEFEAQDAVAYSTEGGKIIGRRKESSVTDGGTVVPGGWDHEHCALCWESISLHKEHQHIGYTDGNDWLCETCYKTYIVTSFGQKLGDKA